jgi:hypothetical protein
MRNYNDEIEAAYLTSKRQGDMMRDRDRERSPHEDRRNRYRDDRYAYGPTSEERQRWEDSRVEQNNSQSPERDNRGKGPRNYKRSDDRPREIVCDMFCDDPYLDASDIDVEVKNSEITLTGYVNDRYEKRLAEHIAENIQGVTHIENRLRVNEERKESNQRERVNQDTE